MPCGCKEHNNPFGHLGIRADVPHSIHPNDACAMCAEKHVSTAYALAMEVGYSVPNRQHIIGELVAAAWHIVGMSPKTAAALRDMRHLIQERQEATVEWDAVLAELDALATEQARVEAAADFQIGENNEKTD